MTEQNILILDDEADIRELLEITLSRMGLTTHAAATLREAIQLLKSQQFKLCLTDMRLPDGTGLELISYIQHHHPERPVAVITAYGSVETAINSLKAGAFDFISKPVQLEQLRSVVNSALKLKKEQASLSVTEESRLLGEAPPIIALRQQIRKLSRSQAPVYISGESGTGKELVAHLIHSQGPRASGPFVPVNCGAIPTELMESEFFGHKKGSFTGALEDKTGLFQAADSGTLFLDEVADLPLAMQVKLLRAIQEKAVRPIGGHREIAVDTRILSATHKDLAQEVDAGRFRGDLFYRINVIQLQVPALRERSGDIPLLADFILDRLARNWGTLKPELSRSAFEALDAYTFPGNVRELENILERAVTLCEEQCIHPEDLNLQCGQSVPEVDRASAEKTEAKKAAFNNTGLTEASDTAGKVHSLEAFLQDIEKDLIHKALERTRWNKTEAAKSLGLSFRALRYRIKKLEME